MFCVKCGKKGRDTIDGLCIGCFLDGRDIIALPHHVDLERCTNCEEFHINGRWSPLDLIEAVEDAAADSLMAINEAKVLEIPTGTEELDPRNFLVTVEAETDVHGIISKETRTTVVRIKNTVCKRCSRQLGNYYEATLQIRSAGKLSDDERDEIIRKIRNDVEQMARNNRQLFITKVEEVSGGVDMLMSSISMTRSIAKDISDSYGGEFKESSKLVGKTSGGEDMYRLTYLIRLPEYHVGDVVRFGDVLYKLLWTGKNGVKLLGLNDFRETTVRKGDMRSLKLAASQDDLKDAVVVSVSGNEMQVLHPSTYQTVDLRIPEDTEVGETAKVAIIEDEMFFVP